mmetsp:Transcript_20929/g.59188  ORF Transcript_20929/g.59188 Transcript_20929/m.59188 type:complete len:220 (-) Transcript_20929:99-758(-)
MLPHAAPHLRWAAKGRGATSIKKCRRARPPMGGRSFRLCCDRRALPVARENTCVRWGGREARTERSSTTSAGARINRGPPSTTPTIPSSSAARGRRHQRRRLRRASGRARRRPRPRRGRAPPTARPRRRRHRQSPRWLPRPQLQPTASAVMRPQLRRPTPWMPRHQRRGGRTSPAPGQRSSPRRPAAGAPQRGIGRRRPRRCTGRPGASEYPRAPGGLL